MSTHNIPFHDKIKNAPKIPLNICFIERSEEFPRHSNTCLNQRGYTSHRISSH